MIAYLDERPLNTIPRRAPFDLSELREWVYDGFDDTVFCLEVSISVEDTDCEDYGLTEDGYIAYPFDYIVHEKVDGTTGYTVLVEVSDSALNHPIVKHLSEGDLTILKRAIALLSE